MRKTNQGRRKGSVTFCSKHQLTLTDNHYEQNSKDDTQKIDTVCLSLMMSDAKNISCYEFLDKLEFIDINLGQFLILDP